MAKNDDKNYNASRPTWGYRLSDETKEDLLCLLEKFKNKQALLDYLIKLGLKAHLELEQLKEIDDDNS